MADSLSIRDNLPLIRRTYGVPAELGRRVILGPGFSEDAGKVGVIRGTDAARLILEVEGRERIYHPTWELEYLDA